MATRTAPTIDGSVTELALTLRWIDHSGDQRATRLIMPSGATDVQLEAVAATAQTLSNASLWQAKVEEIYTGAKLASNATNQTYPSVYDNIVLLQKNPRLSRSKPTFPPLLASQSPAATMWTLPTPITSHGVMRSLPRLPERMPRKACASLSGAKRTTARRLSDVLRTR